MLYSKNYIKTHQLQKSIQKLEKRAKFMSNKSMIMMASNTY